MKKLKMNLSEIEGLQVLTREQLKKVVGGGTCGATWNSANQTGTINITSGDVLHAVRNSNGSTTYTLVGTTYSNANQAFTNGGTGARWCCDGCASASWYH